MKQIDKILTDAVLRDVKYFEFDAMINDIQTDIENLRKLIDKHKLTDLTGISVLLAKEELLRNLSREWLESVGLSAFKNHRIVILMEEDTE